MADVDLSTVVCISNCEYAGGVITRGGSGSTTYMTFIVPSLRVVDGAAPYTVEVELSGASDDVYVYSSQGPTALDWGMSYGFYLGDPNGYDDSLLTTLPFTIGPGLADFDAALADGETYVGFQVRHLVGRSDDIIAIHVTGAPDPDPDPGPTTTVKIPANGSYAGNGFNAPTPGGGGLIGDESDTSYLDFPEGGGNATVGLEIPSVTPVAPLSLHLRMRVLVSDPTGFAGHGEVFLNTQADGSSGTEFAGFSDGSTSGFGFNLPATIATETVEFAVPLNLGPWSPTTFDDVVSALMAGVYLDFNAWIWEGGSFTPTFRLFEAWLEFAIEEAPSGEGNLETRRLFAGRHR